MSTLLEASPKAQRRDWLIGVALSVMVGGFVSVQSIANGTLRVEIDDPLLPSLTSFLVALVIIGLVVASRRSSRANLRSFFTQLGSKQLSRSVLLAGVFGTVFSIAQSVSVATLGVAVFTVAVIAGQNVGGLAVDRAGIGGSGVHTLDPLRIVAAAVATGAVVLAVSGGLSGMTFPVALVVFVFIGGVCVSIQLAMSGRVTVAVGDPLVASLNVFVVGIGALIVAIAIHSFTAAPQLGKVIPAVVAQPWLAIGGICAAIMMTASAVAVPKVGVLVFAMATVIGQLLVALIIDAFMGHVTSPATLLLACGLTVVSVIIAGQASRLKRKAAR